MHNTQCGANISLNLFTRCAHSLITKTLCLNFKFNDVWYAFLVFGVDWCFFCLFYLWNVIACMRVDTNIDWVNLFYFLHRYLLVLRTKRIDFCKAKLYCANKKELYPCIVIVYLIVTVILIFLSCAYFQLVHSFLKLWSIYCLYNYMNYISGVLVLTNPILDILTRCEVRLQAHLRGSRLLLCHVFPRECVSWEYSVAFVLIFLCCFLIILSFHPEYLRAWFLQFWVCRQLSPSV